MTTKNTTKREDLGFWLDKVYDARQSLEADIRNYGSSPEQAAAVEALNVVISQYRHRIHDVAVMEW